jgi:hypothetical protein
MSFPETSLILGREALGHRSGLHSIALVIDLQDGEFFQGPALVLSDRLLRVTFRCLEEDLGGGRALEDLGGVPIVKAFVRERRDKFVGTREVSPLSSGRPVSVLGHGDRHRGGTWHDTENDVVWLLACGEHRSGNSDDFYPYCKELDERGVLLPSEADYEALFRDRDQIFARRLMIEVPLLLKRARERAGEEVTATLGGRFGTGVVVEVASDLEAITVAFDTRTLSVWTYISAILGSLAPGDDWDQVGEMPSRDLASHEVAYEWVGKA